jgi:hypothetical protein
MTFLVEPRCETTLNSEMDEEQIVIGETFLDELVLLGVLIKLAPGEMVANGPFFCLPKPGQPGQWRILSDMRRGGQKEAIGANPTVFPKSGSILEQLFTRGYSGVINASKFFYQFPTQGDKRRYLGCIHPRWDDLFYVYAGLPMGAGKLPVLQATMAPLSLACCVPSAIFIKVDRTTTRGGAPTNGALRLIQILGKGRF